MVKNRYLKILLLPILAVVFFVGYALAVVGEPKQRKTHNPQPNQPTQNPTSEMEIGVLIPQEEQVQTVCNKTEKE
jgi:hypothetical protein